MKLKELEGKKVIRTRPREWLSNAGEKMTDGSWMGREMKLLKVTEGLAYFLEKDLKYLILANCQYDDGFWEESLIDWLNSPNSVKFIVGEPKND